MSIASSTQSSLHGHGKVQRPPHGRLAWVARRIVRVLVCVVAVPSISDQPALSHERVYLTPNDMAHVLVGKNLVSRNLATGMLSRWEFRSDGQVYFVDRSAPGGGSGKWVIHADGSMCLTMKFRTGCHYWFRKGSKIAGSSTREQDAPTEAEIQLN